MSKTVYPDTVNFVTQGFSALTPEVQLKAVAIFQKMRSEKDDWMYSIKREEHPDIVPSSEMFIFFCHHGAEPGIEDGFTGMLGSEY